MLKLLTAEQTRLADHSTITNKPISSVDLMESASKAFVGLFKELFPEKTKGISIYCGTGNNGGDGLAVARLLKADGYQSLSVKIVRIADRTTADFDTNYSRLAAVGIEPEDILLDTPSIDDPSEIIIDAILGSGLNKPLQGGLERLVKTINNLPATVVSIDAPTGFFTDGPVSREHTTIQAQLTITFQRPKINYLLPESEMAMDDFEVVDIGLDENFIQSADSPYRLLEESDISSRLRTRTSFSHKGTFGHALIIAGTDETMGAALLASGASLHAGSGLTSACIPSGGLTALNATFPEIMAVLRDKSRLSQIDWSKYQAIAIGPGLGKSAESKKVLETSFLSFKKPHVIDADAINLISENYELMALVPEGSIFTPHVKEFDRLFGKHDNWWERLQTGMERATTLKCVIVLKNRFTIIFTPEGQCIFNPTGNPAMASGGMGDVLTGITASFLAQGYAPADAAILAVYLHGKAGDELVAKNSQAVVLAGQLLRKLPETIGSLH